jgi:hypothetical protein
VNDRRFPALIILDNCKSWRQIGTTATWYFLLLLISQVKRVSRNSQENGCKNVTDHFLIDNKENLFCEVEQAGQNNIWGWVKILGWGEKTDLTEYKSLKIMMKRKNRRGKSYMKKWQ